MSKTAENAVARNTTVFSLSPDQERAEEDERDKVAVSKVSPTASLVVWRRGERGNGGVWFTLLTWQTGEHDLLPGLSCRTPDGLNTNKHLVDLKLHNFEKKKWEQKSINLNETEYYLVFHQAFW